MNLSKKHNEALKKELSGMKEFLMNKGFELQAKSKFGSRMTIF